MEHTPLRAGYSRPVSRTPSATSAPRASVVIPLYRSAPFLPIIRGNIGRLAGCEVEVLVSDRHGFDDAIDVLEREFGHDPRLRFLRATDGIGWVGHFNVLMAEARSEFVVWMQHDDTFPAGYVDTLVAAAHAVPGCAIAFGRLEWESLDDRPAEHMVPIGCGCEAGQWGPWSPYRLLGSGWIGAPFRGALRRACILRTVGPLRETLSGCAAEQAWVFAIALTAPLVFTPDTYCIKRMHGASITGRLRRSPAEFWSSVRVLPAYLRTLTGARRTLARAAWGAFTLARIAYHTAVRPVMPTGAARALRDRLYRALGGGNAERRA